MSVQVSVSSSKKRPTGRTLSAEARRERRIAREKVVFNRLKWAFRVLAFSPRRAGALAERLFQRARRFRRPEWERAILASGTRFHYLGPDDVVMPATSWGEGPVVALMHGWEGRGSQLGAFVAPLVAAGFKVVAIDAPGHGDAPDGLANPMVFAETLRRLEHWMGGLHAVIAHSFGALGTAYAFYEGLTAARVVLVAPATSPRVATETMAQMLSLPPDIVGDLQRRLEKRVKLQLDDIENGRLFSHIACPVLVVHDVDDEEVSTDDAEAIAATTDARVRWTRGLGHRRILRDPGVLARVTSFIEEAPRPRVDPWRSFLVDSSPF